jgi:hypothetical protein
VAGEVLEERRVGGRDAELPRLNEQLRFFVIAFLEFSVFLLW